jgi:threonine dehydratase
LIGGIGAWMEMFSPQSEVIGCWHENARTLYESLGVARIIEFQESATLSESTAGSLEADSITFQLCQEFVKRKILVTEPEILNAMGRAKQKGWTVEGAAGVAIAGFFEECRTFPGQECSHHRLWWKCLA